MKPHRRFHHARTARRLAALAALASASAGCADQPPTAPSAATEAAAPAAAVSAADVSADLGVLDDAVERMLPAVSTAARNALRDPLGRLRAEVAAGDRVAAAASVVALRGTLRALERTVADDADLAALSLALDQIER